MVPPGALFGKVSTASKFSVCSLLKFTTRLCFDFFCHGLSLCYGWSSVSLLLYPICAGVVKGPPFNMGRNHLTWHKLESLPSQNGFHALKSWSILIWLNVALTETLPALWYDMTRLFLLFSDLLEGRRTDSCQAEPEAAQAVTMWKQKHDLHLVQSDSYHLLPFKGQLWWFCFLVLASQTNPELVGPSLSMAEWGWNQTFNISSNPNHSMILSHEGIFEEPSQASSI